RMAVSAATSSPKSGGKQERYTPAARRENHRHTTDFIPRGLWSLGLWYFAGLAAVGGLLFGYTKLASESIIAVGLAPLLDAVQGGSLASWLSSLIFTLAAVGSVLIYSIRRHKLDDYRGRYRLWLWCAAAWSVMSIDATANLHTPFSLVMSKLSGW